MSARGLLQLRLLVAATAIAACVAQQSDEQLLRVLTVRLDTATTRHSLELAAIRKDMDEMRQEMKSYKSCNEKHNSQLTLEWAMNAVAELRQEMKEVEAANNASDWQQELRNEVATVLAEAEGVTKLAAADGARLAVEEAKLAELILDVSQLRQLVTETHTSSDSLKEDIRKIQQDWKTSIKLLDKKINYISAGNKLLPRHDTITDINFDYHKLRHMHSITKQILELKKMNKNIYNMQMSLREDVNVLQEKIRTMENDKPSIEEIIDSQKQNTNTIKNITNEIGNFNKMHTSMLELLENMESLENKIDKTIPDFKKEISKLDLDVVQLKSQNQYLKEDHENVHQTVKAIAVTVSNLVDKIDIDHSLLEKLNLTVNNRWKSEEDEKDIERKNYNVDVSPNLTNSYQTLKNAEKTLEGYLPVSCDEIEGTLENCLIAPNPGQSFMTSCIDGKTLVQQRLNGSINFNQNYKKYASGFGDPRTEFWIGNEALHRLTTDNCSMLNVDLVDTQGNQWFAKYEYFHVDSVNDGYRLYVGGYSGNASDALEYQNGMQFSTVDEDRDTSKYNCAVDYEGGWWFSHCQHANLNGKYSLGLTWFNSKENKRLDISKSRMTIEKRYNCKVT